MFVLPWLTTDFRQKDIICASNSVNIGIDGENKIRRFKTMFYARIHSLLSHWSKSAILATEIITTSVKPDNDMHQPIRSFHVTMPFLSRTKANYPDRFNIIWENVVCIGKTAPSVFYSAHQWLLKMSPLTHSIAWAGLYFCNQNNIQSMTSKDHKNLTTHTFHLSVYHCLVDRTYLLPVLYGSFPYWTAIDTQAPIIENV